MYLEVSEVALTHFPHTRSIRIQWPQNPAYASTALHQNPAIKMLHVYIFVSCLFTINAILLNAFWLYWHCVKNVHFHSYSPLNKHVEIACYFANLTKPWATIRLCAKIFYGMARLETSDNCMGREGNKRESDKEVNRVGFEHRKKKRGNKFCANALIFIQRKIIKKR